MKRLRYILAVLLSLAVVYAGVGVSIAHYCCARCETAQSCCTSSCSKCNKDHHQSEKSCKDKGCTATFYKVDLVKYSCDSPVIVVPVVHLFCVTVPEFRSSLSGGELREVAYNVPPHPVSSRQYLALYSVLVI